MSFIINDSCQCFWVKSLCTPVNLFRLDEQVAPIPCAHMFMFSLRFFLCLIEKLTSLWNNRSFEHCAAQVRTIQNESESVVSFFFFFSSEQQEWSRDHRVEMQIHYRTVLQCEAWSIQAMFHVFFFYNPNIIFCYKAVRLRVVHQLPSIKDNSSSFSALLLVNEVIFIAVNWAFSYSKQHAV